VQDDDEAMRRARSQQEIEEEDEIEEDGP
jgi:hypothetical protein